MRVVLQSSSLSPATTLKRVEKLCELVTANTDAAKDAIASSAAVPHQMLDRVAFEVKQPVKRTRNQLSKLNQSFSDSDEEVAASKR